MLLINKIKKCIFNNSWGKTAPTIAGD